MISLSIQISISKKPLFLLEGGFHSLWFLSDVDNQRAWRTFLIEGFFHDLFYCATILV